MEDKRDDAQALGEKPLEFFLLVLGHLDVRADAIDQILLGE